ncbi:LysR family transcriptional regulator ArgP [Acinetobacter sp.]|uniref:LysR family transcriptional regulator ArgP n=1 Tax=Acinetobacter sp. TaxID=472 RepID=UPI0026488E67|nr:LysR family transcriptional regulator ArgP [Acinetobacter sp.]MDN5511475.1 LysR family transcriptional regulator ArgP [Acinetobacter sp.]MDN5523514.1 LysR family transcriptional regulator ArgP [Acinetobacter sp.]
MLSSKSCEAFLAVAESGSFDEAAQRLCITASAVTLRVQALEKDLGQILLLRERPCRVTQAGQKLLEHLQHHRLREQNLLQQFMGQSSQHEFHQFSIATNADSLSTWLLKVLQNTLIKQKIALKLSLDDQTQTHQLLETGLVNACISTESTAMKGCEVHYLGQMTYRMVATASFVEKWFKDGIHRDALRHAPAIIFNGKDLMHHQVILNLFGLNQQSYPHYFIPSSTAFVEAVHLGLGFGLVPQYQIGDDLQTGKLIEVIPDAKTEMKLYWHHWKQQSALLQQLTLDLLENAQPHMN